MKKKILIELELCDRNRNFWEIIEGIKKLIIERDGVDKLKIKSLD